MYLWSISISKWIPGMGIEVGRQRGVSARMEKPPNRCLAPRENKAIGSSIGMMKVSAAAVADPIGKRGAQNLFVDAIHLQADKTGVAIIECVSALVAG